VSHAQATRYTPDATAFDDERPWQAIASSIATASCGFSGRLGGLTSVLVQMLLHWDRLVRVAAVSLAFNASAWVQWGHVAWDIEKMKV
jgi:hypothetical protein